MSKAANTARLKRMHTRAKQIQKNRGGSYRMALKAAGAMERGKSVTGVKKRRTKKAPRRITKKAVSMAKPRRMGKVGSIQQTKSKLRKQLEEQLAWGYVARDSARKVSDRKKKQKKISEIKKDLRAIGALGKRR